jgi:hypothetical protein
LIGLLKKAEISRRCRRVREDASGVACLSERAVFQRLAGVGEDDRFVTAASESVNRPRTTHADGDALSANTGAVRRFRWRQLGRRQVEDRRSGQALLARQLRHPRIHHHDA